MEHHQPGQGDMPGWPGGAGSLGTGLELQEHRINRWGMTCGGQTEGKRGQEPWKMSQCWKARSDEHLVHLAAAIMSRWT